MEVCKAGAQLPDICLERTVRFTGGHLRCRRAGIHLKLGERATQQISCAETLHRSGVGRKLHSNFKVNQIYTRGGDWDCQAMHGLGMPLDEKIVTKGVLTPNSTCTECDGKTITYTMSNL